MLSRKRVVVTGLGAVSAAGRGVGPFWRACVEGQSMLRPISRFDANEYGSPPAGEVPPGGNASENAVAEYTLDAVREAILQSGLSADMDTSSMGIVLGTCLGEAEAAFECLRANASETSRPAQRPVNRPLGFASPTERVAEAFGLSGPALTLSSACASGTSAMGVAADCIRRGEASTMLVCGVEMLSRFVVSGFWLLRALTSTVVRPFDRRRDGLALGEGAGVLVLEERDRALRRGATALAEVLGSASSGDAHHMTGPSPTGDGLVRAIEGALRDARDFPGKVDFISAHGTGTRYNDLMETIAIKRVFREDAHGIPVVSIKPVVGHTLGAAGALDAIVSVKVLREGVVPPTINYGEPDPECDLDYVPNCARSQPVRRVLSCSSAFAGNNSAVLMATP